MSYRKAIAVSLLLVCAFTGLQARPQEDFGSGAIRTPYGFLLVQNGENNHYTLEIRGEKIQTFIQHPQFLVDGMFLQVLTAPISEFSEVEKRKAMDDKAILEAHRDYEVKFMQGENPQQLKVESSWQKLSNGKDALGWQVSAAEGAQTIVKKQTALTLIKGDFVLMLGGFVTDTVTENASRQLLLSTALTLKTSEQPIDMRKLQESFRKEAPSEVAVDQTKTANLKGRVHRSDTKEPIPNAEIFLAGENKSDNARPIVTRTDAQGNYTLARVPAGTYTLSIKAWYPTQEAAPCKLLLGKTSDKNSSVIVVSDQGKFYQLVMIKGFAVKAGKDISKDFDFVCQSMFGN